MIGDFYGDLRDSVVQTTSGRKRMWRTKGVASSNVRARVPAHNAAVAVAASIAIGVVVGSATPDLRSMAPHADRVQVAADAVLPYGSEDDDPWLDEPLTPAEMKLIRERMAGEFVPFTDDPPSI